LDSLDLCWRAEEACLNAFPSPCTVLAAGWLIRASGGPVRRTNSVNPLRGASFDPTPILPEASQIYQRLGQPLIVRVPAMAVGLDEALTAGGFAAPEAETLTLLATLAPRRPQVEVALSERPSQAWLGARAEMSGADEASAKIYALMLRQICAPVRFAAIGGADGLDAIAYGAISRGILVIESVATRHDRRGRGLGSAVVAALLTWAHDLEVAQACLQVMANNRSAITLYQRLGFDALLYRYHYRRI